MHDFGEPLKPDPTWQGYATDRKCRDVIPGAIFGLYFIGMLVVGFTAFSKGNPQILTDLKNSPLVQNWLDKAVIALHDEKGTLIATAFGALALAALWLVALRHLAKQIIYLTLALGISGVVALGVVVINIGAKNDLLYVKIGGFVVIGVALILAGIVFCLRDRIQFTAVMISEACRALGDNITLFTVISPLTLGLYLLFAAFWVGSMIYLFTVPKTTSNNSSSSSLTLGAHAFQAADGGVIEINDNIRWLSLYMIFGGFWVIIFIGALISVVFSGAVSQWYFGRGGAAVSGVPALTALKHAMTHSFGSLALGSLVLAFFSLINYILKKARDESPNRFLKYLFSCVLCFCGCLQAVIAYLTSYAWIYVAMYGHSFFESAKATFNLMGRSGLQRVVTDVITHYVLLLGTAFCTGLMVGITALVHKDNLNLWALLIAAVLTATVFHFVSLAVRVGADTIFVCYLEDLERNSATKNYFISPDLHDAIQERAKASGKNNKQPINTTAHV